jgi:hypothetical protein
VVVGQPTEPFSELIEQVARWSGAEGIGAVRAPAGPAAKII